MKWFALCAIDGAVIIFAQLFLRKSKWALILLQYELLPHQ